MRRGGGEKCVWCMGQAGNAVRRVALLMGLLALVAPSSEVGAQGFAAYISPPLFEVKVKPGKTLRQIVEITSASPLPSGFNVYTADWRLNADGSATFVDALEPGSCRPWVAIERREFRLAPTEKFRFRFEVSAPAEAPEGECRFALMFEGTDELAVAGMGNLPIAARVAVIVYVAVGDARPSLTVLGSQVVERTGQRLAALRVRNSGRAHGRTGGFLDATDARGRRYELLPAETPILPMHDGWVAPRVRIVVAPIEPRTRGRR